MGNDLEVSTGQGQIAVKSNEVVKKLSDLERGGYYKTVKAPGEYFAEKNKEGSSTSDELEIDDDSKSETDKGIEPLKHWNTKIKKKFNECTDSQKEAWKDSFKIIEKGYVKQLNELKEDLQSAQPIIEMMEPYKEQLEKLGVTAEKYLSDLVRFDELLGANPAYEIARLIAIYQVPYESLIDYLKVANKDISQEASISKYVNPLKKEISQLKKAIGGGQTSPEIEEAAKEQSDSIINKITMFFEQRDAEGKERYPHAFENIQDILELVQTGENLEDAYNLVVNGEKKEVANKEVEYEEPSDVRKKSPLTSQEKEREMLLRKLSAISN
jgi:hypothetical protein